MPISLRNFSTLISRRFLTYLFIIVLIVLYSISPCFARTENVFVGDIGEKYLDYLHTSTYSFQPDKWEKINGEIGRNGIDGLYVKRHKGGVISRVLIGESKYGTSVLGRTKYGRQMSQRWVENKVEKLIRKTERDLKKSRHWKQRQSIRKTLDDYQSIKKHLLYSKANKANTVRKQVYKSKITNGRLYVKRHNVIDLNQKNVSLGPPIRGKGQLDDGIRLSNDEINKVKIGKNRNFHIKEREKFFTQMRRGLIQKDKLSRYEANKIIDDIKNGKINDGKDLKRVRNDAINKRTIGKLRKDIIKYSPKKFRKNLTGYISFFEKNKTFRSLFGKSLTGLKFVSFVSAALEFKFIYDWRNNQISNRQFIENTAMLLGGNVGYHVGKEVGEGAGAIVGFGLNYFGVQVDVTTTKTVGKTIGAIAGAYIGAREGQQTVNTYFDIKDKEALENYKVFLRKHLMQTSL